MKITVILGDAGFGSQFLSVLSGIAVAKVNQVEFVHTPLRNIKLVNHNEFQNSDLGKANEMINEIIRNLGLKIANDREPVVVVPFFHDYIYDRGVDNYYSEEFLSQLHKSYPLPRPECYGNDKLNIAIHIRRGDDIVGGDMSSRHISDELYDPIIRKFRLLYPDAIIHIVS